MSTSSYTTNEIYEHITESGFEHPSVEQFCELSKPFKQFRFYKSFFKTIKNVVSMG